MPKQTTIRIGTLIQQEFFDLSCTRQKMYSKGDVLLGAIIDVKSGFFRVIFNDFKSDYFPEWLIDCTYDKALDEGFTYIFKVKYY